MASKAAYTVRHVSQKHVGALPPIAFEIREALSPFSFTDYLTADEAMKVAAMLTHAAMQVREESEVVVEAEERRMQVVETTLPDENPFR